MTHITTVMHIFGKQSQEYTAVQSACTHAALCPTSLSLSESNSTHQIATESSYGCTFSSS